MFSPGTYARLRRMRFLSTRPVARVLLAVMLATFLAPSFGWHMHAGHDEIAADVQSLHGHEHDGEHHATDDDGQAGDAHESIGHLLGHLPMQMSKFEVVLPLAEDVAPSAAVSAPLIVSETSPPYRPPLPLRPA